MNFTPAFLHRFKDLEPMLGLVEVCKIFQRKLGYESLFGEYENFQGRSPLKITLGHDEAY